MASFQVGVLFGLAAACCIAISGGHRHNLLPKSLLGEECFNKRQCKYAGSDCLKCLSAVSATCVCPKGTYVDDTTQTCPVQFQIGEECSNKDQCEYAGSDCLKVESAVSETCVCPYGTYVDADNKACPLQVIQEQATFQDTELIG